MATPSIPSFRSLNQILGEMVQTFLSELDRRGIVPGIQSLKPGSPYLAVFEAVAQSQFRNQQQALDVLDANDLDIAHGDRLDRIGQAEGVSRRGATFASGFATILDSSFTKVSTKIYQGKPALIPGSTVIYVADASLFPATGGSLYVGRNTTNYEGPLAYTATSNQGSYWKITLSSGVTNFHGLSEEVVLAQGGTRLVPAGQVVTTPLGNQGTSASFSTVNSATVLDGETEVEDVAVVCQIPGVSGNVPAGAIKVVSSPAFVGMAVTNPLPISNGLDVEGDDHYRERVRAARRVRAKAIPLALEQAAYGVQAPDQAATVTSAQYVARQSLLDQLVIDDGTGYEPISSGIALETLIDSAVGGETRFYLVHGRPVAKASMTTIASAPFALADQDVLTVKVGGLQNLHGFDAASFSDVSSATAFEVVASINSNPALSYSARTSSSGTKVTLFAKGETSEDIQVLAGAANEALEFPILRVDTLRLYKNDVLLSKDGSGAFVTTKPQSSWVGIISGDTLIISVDGTSEQTYAVTDSDFVALGEGVNTVAASNPLSAWTKVFNDKIPGITCSILGSSLVLTSNLGLSSRASIEVNPSSTLVTKGMFDSADLSDKGTDANYTLDRNFGFIELAKSLEAGDKLTAGTQYTRAYIQSGNISAGITVTSPGADLWFAVDGDAKAVLHSLNATHRLKMEWGVGTSTPIRRFTAFVGAGVSSVYSFLNVEQGDWVVFTRDIWGDSTLWSAWSSVTAYADDDVVSYSGSTYVSRAGANTNNQPNISPAWWALVPTNFGAYRVSNVDVFGQWVEVEAPNISGAADFVYNSSTYPAFQYVAFSRAIAELQRVHLAAGTYTQAQVVTAFNVLLGATATSSGNYLRVATNTYNEGGDIALAAQSQTALVAMLSAGDATKSDVPQAASVESGNLEVGTPAPASQLSVSGYSVISALPAVQPTSLADKNASGSIYGAYWLRPLPTATFLHRYGTNSDDHASWVEKTASGWTRLDHVLAQPIYSGQFTDFAPDRILPVNHFHVGPTGTLNVVFDDEPVTKSYSVAMTRLLSVDVAVPYGQTIRLKDADNLDGSGNPQSIALAFGTNFDFRDFALHAHARAKLQVTGDLTTRALFRLKDWRARIATAKVSILAPTSPSQVQVVTNAHLDGSPIINLPSGTERAVTWTLGGKLLLANNGLGTSTLASALIITSITRVVSTVTVTVGMPNTDVVDHQWQVGNVVYVNIVHADFPAGFKTITARTATTFDYTEAGNANTVNNPANAWVAWSSTPVDFSLAQVNDYLSIWISASYWSLVDAPGRDRTSARIQLVSTDVNGIFWVRTRDLLPSATDAWKVIQNLSGTQDFFIFPLSGPPTMSSVVTALNADANATVTGALLDTGAGTIVKDYLEDSALSAVLADGCLHVGSSVYNVGIANYDLTLKQAPDATLTTTPNDWTNEKFKLAPTTAKNVADYLNRGQVTGLASASASIQASSLGHKVQITSGVLGSGGSVKVSGGSANAVRLTALGSHVFSSNLYTTVASSTDLDAVSTHQWVSVDNTSPLAKILNWTASTTFQAVNGACTLGVAGTAWAYANSQLPVFGGRWLVQKVGKFTAVIPSFRGAFVAPTLPNVGDWFRVEAGSGEWESAGNISQARIGSAVVTMADGRVLVIGGGNQADFSAGPFVAYNSVDIYDPSTKQWSVAAVLPSDRAFGAACLLSNGKVLFCGGVDSSSVYKAEAWEYDPSSNSWAASTSPTMVTARSHHTASKMSDGTVVIVGGATAVSTYTNLVERYTPNPTGTFASRNPMAKNRAGHHAFVYGTDKILVVGGSSSSAAAGYEDYDLNLNIWQHDAPLGFGERRVGHAAVQLSSSTFMVMGGAGDQNLLPTGWTAASVRSGCEVYDVTSHTATASGAIGSLNIPRAGFSAVNLVDGRVLAVGGIATNAGSPSAEVSRSAEVYSVTGNSWAYASGSFYPYALQHIFVNSDGTVVVGGDLPTLAGAADNKAETFLAAELASPAGNVGWFQVAQVSSDSIYLESDATESGEWSFGLVAFYDYNSVIPGDYLRVSSNVFGSGKDGSYAVASIDLNDNKKFVVSGNLSITNFALGSSLPFVSVLPAEPAHLNYEVEGVYPNDAGEFYVRLTPNVHQELVTASAGSVLTFLDKLNFPSNLSVGQDSYKYHTGLIGEVNLVVYGNERDSDTYPGFAAAGAEVDITAPLIRRVTLSLAVRQRAGAVDVKTRVQSAAAQVVNAAEPGPIPLSLIIEAVQQVDGVNSVVLLSPVPSVGADTIPVQPGEKALILDLETDVQVTFI